MNRLSNETLSRRRRDTQMAGLDCHRHVDRHDIDLLITDVVMPEMNGRELSERLRNLCANLKTLFMPGYTANVIARRGVLEDGVCFVSKPFIKKEMAAKVREVLDDTIG